MASLLDANGYPLEGAFDGGNSDEYESGSKSAATSCIDDREELLRAENCLDRNARTNRDRTPYSLLGTFNADQVRSLRLEIGPLVA